MALSDEMRWIWAILVRHLGGEGVRAVLLLEAPGADRAKAQQDGQGRGHAEAPAGTGPQRGMAAALGFPAEAVGEFNQFGIGLGGPGGSHLGEAEQFLQLGPQFDILRRFEPARGIRPGHARLHLRGG